MFWSEKEILNQIIHFVLSFTLSFALTVLLENRYFAISGFILGILVESYQYFIKKERLKLLDRIRDLCFYLLGSGLVLLLCLDLF